MESELLENVNRLLQKFLVSTGCEEFSKTSCFSDHDFLEAMSRNTSAPTASRCFQYKQCASWFATKLAWAAQALRCVTLLESATWLTPFRNDGKSLRRGSVFARRGAAVARDISFVKNEEVEHLGTSGTAAR